MRIPLSSPDITDLEIAAVTAVMRTPTLALGPKAEEFEDRFSAFTKTQHAIAVSSGTAGLHLCLRALDIHEGDEVIIPSFAFIAVGNAVLYERAVPVFVDIDPVTFNLDASKLETAITPKTRAIIVVHTFGLPVDLDAIVSIARRHNIPVIEDACEAIGADVGNAGDLAVFAFYPNKQITTGEGGMVVTNNAALATKIRSLRNHGRDSGLLGYNYRLSEIACAIGIEQLKRLPEILEKRRQVADLYSKLLEGLSTPAPRHSWFVYTILIPNRDEVFQRLTANGIGAARYFTPIHRQPLFGVHASLPITETIAAQTLQLPFFNNLTEAQAREVCHHLRST